MNTDFINAEWIKRWCEIEIASETKRWEENGRPKNDGYINGSHSGHTHALEHLKGFIECIERMKPVNSE